VVSDPVSTLRRWQSRTVGSPTIILGDGAALYADVVSEHGSNAYRVVSDVPPLAGTIGCMASVLASMGAVTSASGIQPLYVRRPDAEIDRERRAAASRPARDDQG
jgi:hypothetical protein